jgi:uncharacterized protein
MALALAMTSAVGITRIRMDDSLSQRSHSDTPEIQTLSTGDAQVSSSEFDVLIVVEGKSLLKRSSIEKLRNLVTDVQLIDGARGIISLFFARNPAWTRDTWLARFSAQSVP